MSENKIFKSVFLFIFIFISVTFLGSFVFASDWQDNWTLHTEPFGSGSAIRYSYSDGTYWVIVGDDGKLATATDPTGTWTLRNSGFGTSHIYCIATDGTYWVIVGNDGKLATATDPTGTWTLRSNPFGSDTIRGITTNGTTWVAVGNGGKMMTATDPTGTWTMRTSSFSSTDIHKVATDGTIWVAVGRDGKLATATDPTGTWTQRTTGFGTGIIYEVTYEDPIWVIGGYAAKMFTSTDPTGTWTQRTSSFSNSDIHRIKTDGTNWIAVGDNGKIASATDPTGTWTQRTSPFDNNQLLALNTANNYWLIGSEQGDLGTTVADKIIFNPSSDPLYTFQGYDWNLLYSDVNYSCDYNYSWGFDNDSNIDNGYYKTIDSDVNLNTLGSNVVDNSTFQYWIDDDPINWTLSASENANNYITVDAHGARIVSDGTFFGIKQNKLEIGHKYFATIKIYSMSGGGLTFGDSVSTSHDILYLTSSGTYTVEFTATANYVSIKRRSSSVDAVIEEVKVQEVSSDYYDLSYEPLIEDINSGIYSWAIVDKYCDGSFVSRDSISSSDTFDINYNVDHSLYNPSAPVYIFKDYNFTYSVQDNSYDSNKTYKYDFGINTSKSLSGATEYVSDESLSIDSNSVKTFYVTHDVNEDYVNLDLYSYITLYTYDNGSLVDTNTVWSSSTFKPLYNLDVNIDHPNYPDFANRLYPCRLFDWNVTISDKSYDNNASYKYDFGFNDTNSFDGNETETINSEDLNITTTDTEVHFIASEIPESWLDSNIYAYITIYDYDNNNLIETKTYWTSGTAYVNWGLFKLQVFDEDNITHLDEFVKLNDLTTDETYEADSNGLFELDMNLFYCGYNDANIYRETSEEITHPYRQLDMLLNRSSSIDENMYLLNDSNGSYIEYLVKDKDNILWGDKYLLFRYNSGNYVSIYNSNLVNDYSSSETKSTEKGVVIKPNMDIYLTSINLKLNSSNPATQFYIFDKNIDAVVYQGDIPSGSTNVGIPYYNKIKLYEDHLYSIVVDNNGNDYKSYKYNNYLSTDINTTNIDYVSGASSFRNTNTKAYNILSINSVDASKLEFAESEPIILWVKTDSDGKFTGYVKQDGNYTAYLYDEYGVLQDIYDKVKVTIKKPLDEETLAEISPYDVRVGGLLNYNLLNKTDANVSFNVFGGTVDYYSVQVVDYNSVVTDRKYVPRSYLFNIPYGSSFSTTYTIQPYLLLIADGVTPTIYVYDKLKRAIQNIVVEVYKSINGAIQLVQSSQTTSMGRTSFSAYPFDYYTIKLYYKGNLAGTYSVQPRSSSDNYYFLINTVADESAVVGIDNIVDWSGTDTNVNLLTTNPSIDVNISVTSPSGDPELTSYVINVYQDNNLITSSSGDLSGTSQNISTSFNKSLFDTSISSIVYKLDYNYTFGSENYTYSSTFTVAVVNSNTNIFIKLESVPNVIGRIWAIILALLIVISILALITFSGFVTDPKAITVMGIFLIGIFVFLGWLNTGFAILGTDVGVFAYVLSAIFGLFLMLKGGYR